MSFQPKHPRRIRQPGRVNLLDALIGGFIVLAALGVLLVQGNMHVTSGQVVEGETDIDVMVQIPSLKAVDSNLFVPGKETAITIRNQPRGEVKIVSAERNPVRITFMNAQNKPVAVEDVTQPHSFDYFIVLRDHAKITKDGYVAEGVKVKVGLPIELEGFKYRVYGKIIDVQPVKS